MGWGEWGNWLEVVVYKDLECFEEFDRSVVQPNVSEVVLKVINQLSGSVVWAVVPDTEYCGIHSVRVGLYVTNVLRRSPDVLEGPRVERLSPAGSYQLPICCLCAGMRKRGH